jgi:hypothetical protein
LLTVKLSRHGASGATDRTVNGDVQVSLDIFNYHIGQTFQHYLQVAAFVRATARTVDIGQLYYNALNVIITTGQGETQPPFGMAAQGVGQGKIACLDINLHKVLRCNAIVVSRTGMLGGFDSLEKSIIIDILFVINEVMVIRWLTTSIYTTSGR